MERKKLVILTGPTAAGKTALSVKLAKLIGAEIISADSMQVYKGMDIGSAKVRPEETGGIRHHLIDVLDPKEDFNVFKFKNMAVKAIDEICGRGNIPMIVGGTGFYIQSVLYDIDFSENDDNGDIRERLEAEAKEDPDSLYERLKALDPGSCEKIHRNNIKRVIRALEFYELTGKKISEHNDEEMSKPAAYDNKYFVLTYDREKMYQNIDKRVDEMMQNGLTDEVKRLYETGIDVGYTSMQGLGYKEILAYLKGEYDLDRAVYLIKRDTRHFAKRQLTWFKREKDVIMINKDDHKNEDEIIGFMLEELKKIGIERKNLG